jgi:hypothetical protein
VTIPFSQKNLKVDPFIDIEQEAKQQGSFKQQHIKFTKSNFTRITNWSQQV